MPYDYIAMESSQAHHRMSNDSHGSKDMQQTLQMITKSKIDSINKRIAALEAKRKRFSNTTLKDMPHEQFKKQASLRNFKNTSN